MRDNFPRAVSITRYEIQKFVEWRVYFEPHLEFEDWKAVKEWQIQNCEGEWSVDYGMSSSHAKFIREDDAILCLVRFS